MSRYTDLLNNHVHGPCRKIVAGFVFGIVGGAVTGTFLLAPMLMGHRPVSVQTANVMVTKMTHGQAHVIRAFPGPAGLTGVVIQGSQGPLVAWVTDQKSAIIVGHVINDQNQDVTNVAGREYLEPSAATRLLAPGAPTPHTETVDDTVRPPAAALPASASVGTSSVTGGVSGESALKAFVADPHQAAIIDDPDTTGPHTLYAFVDPNCIFCHQFFDLVAAHKAEFNRAGVRVVFVPVAILKQSSVEKAAMVIAGGWRALLQNEMDFNVNTEEGGAARLGASASALSAAHQNTEIMSSLAAENKTQDATPLLVWRASNQHVYYLTGAPGSNGLPKLLRSFSSGWQPEQK